MLIAEAIFRGQLGPDDRSTLVSLWEIWISVDALTVNLRGIQGGKPSH